MEGRGLTKEIVEQVATGPDTAPGLQVAWIAGCANKCGRESYSQVGNLENTTSLLSLFYAGSIDVVVVLITDY